jgi:hypothetical protein
LLSLSPSVTALFGSSSLFSLFAKFSCLILGLCFSPDLGEDKMKLILLGSTYFASELALELVLRLAETDASVQQWRLILAFPVALLGESLSNLFLNAFSQSLLSQVA